jgi:hypothetical protein
LRDRRALSEDRVYRHGLEPLLLQLLPQGCFERLLRGDAREAFVAQVNQWSPQWR